MTTAPREARRAAPLPANLEAERAVLGAALIDPSTLPLLPGLRPDDFHHDGNRLLFEAIFAVAERGGAVDSLTVGAELEARGHGPAVGGAARLALLVEEAALAVNTAAYVQLLQEIGTKRRLAQLGHTVSTWSLNGKPTSEIRGYLDEQLAGLRREPVARPETAAIDATDLLAAPCEARPSLVAGIVEPKTIVVIGGGPKLGKTALKLSLLLRVARGEPWLGFATTPIVSLVYNAEIPPAQLKGRLALLTQDAPLAPGRLFVRTDRSLRLDTPDGQRAIRADVERVRPDLVSFDPLARFMSGDENSTRDMGRVVAFLDSLIQAFDVTTLVVHHTGKPAKDDGREGGQRLRGSSALFAAADSVLLLERQRGVFVLSFQLRHGPEPEPMILERTDRLWFQPARVSEDLQAVAQLAGEGKRFTPLREDLQEFTSVSKATASRLIGQARKLGLVVVEGGLYRSHGLRQSHADDEPEGTTREF